MLRVHFINGEYITIDGTMEDIREDILLINEVTRNNNPIRILQHNGKAFLLHNVTYFEEIDPLKEIEDEIEHMNRSIESADAVLYDGKGGALFKSEEELTYYERHNPGKAIKEG